VRGKSSRVGVTHFKKMIVHNTRLASSLFLEFIIANSLNQRYRAQIGGLGNTDKARPNVI